MHSMRCRSAVVRRSPMSATPHFLRLFKHSPRGPAPCYCTFETSHAKPSQAGKYRSVASVQ